MDNPKDHEGLSFGCNGALGDGETKNETMDIKEPGDYTKAYILIMNSTCLTHIVHTSRCPGFQFYMCILLSFSY